MTPMTDWLDDVITEAKARGAADTILLEEALTFLDETGIGGEFAQWYGWRGARGGAVTARVSPDGKVTPSVTDDVGAEAERERHIIARVSELHVPRELPADWDAARERMRIAVIRDSGVTHILYGGRALCSQSAWPISAERERGDRWVNTANRGLANCGVCKDAVPYACTGMDDLRVACGWRGPARDLGSRDRVSVCPRCTSAGVFVVGG